MENETVIFDVSPLKVNKQVVVINTNDYFVLTYENESFQFDSMAEFYKYFYYRFFIAEREKSERLRTEYEKSIKHCGAYEYSMDNYFHILTVKVSPMEEGVNIAFGKDMSTGEYVMTYKRMQYFFKDTRSMMAYFNKRFMFMAKRQSEKNIAKAKSRLKVCELVR